MKGSPYGGATRPQRYAVVLVVLAAAAMLPGCTSSGPVAPPVPLSNVGPNRLAPDGTFKNNGLTPVDPMQQI